MKIEVSTLRPGVSFTRPVYIEDNNLLVPAGIAVRKRDLQHLSAWGIDTVETDGEMILPHPDLTGNGQTGNGQATPTPVDFGLAGNGQTGNGQPGGSGPGDGGSGAPAGRPAPAAEFTDQNEGGEAWQLYRELGFRFQKVLDRMGSSQAAGELDRIGLALLHGVQEQKSRLAALVVTRDGGGDERSWRGINTAILAARMGLALRLPGHRGRLLVTAALLHEAGTALPPEILRRQAAPGAEEARALQQHLVYPLRLCTALNIGEDAATILIQHHERMDGAGYPKKLGGAETGIEAKILGLAETFEHLLGTGSARSSLAAHGALTRIVAEHTGRFDPEVIRALARTLAVWPVNALVILNNNTAARVAEIRPSAPLRPKIQILAGGTGAGSLIDLLEDNSLYIARTLENRIA